MIRWFEHKQVYVPSRVMETCTLDWPREDVTLTARDGCRLRGWFFPAKKGSLWSELVLLLFHGNAGNICHRRTPDITRHEDALSQRNRISLFAVPQPQCPMKSEF